MSESSTSGGSAGNSDEEIPDFYITEFANAFINNKRISLTDVGTAYLEVATSNANQFTLLTQWWNSIKAELTVLYNYYDNASLESVTLDHFDNLPVLKTVFPSDIRWDLTTLPVRLSVSVPQGLILLDWIGLFDDEHDNFDHLGFLTELGILNTNSSEVSISDVFVRSLRVHLPSDFQNPQTSTWNEQSSLQVEVSVWSSQVTVDRVELIYNDSAGNFQTVDIPSDGFSSGHGFSRYIIHPYFDEMRPTANLITDYQSGAALVKVYAGSQVIERDVTIYNFTNLNGAEWVYPVGLNQNQFFQSLFNVGASTSSMTVIPHDETNGNYVVLRWTPATGTISSGHSLRYVVNLGMTVQEIYYSEPFGDLSGVVSEFTNLNVDASELADRRWIQIWSSYDSNRLIASNEFPVPYNLPVTERNVT